MRKSKANHSNGEGTEQQEPERPPISQRVPTEEMTAKKEKLIAMMDSLKELEGAEDHKLLKQSIQYAKQSIAQAIYITQVESGEIVNKLRK